MEAIIRPIYRMFPGWKDTLMDAASVKKILHSHYSIPQGKNQEDVNLLDTWGIMVNRSCSRVFSRFPVLYISGKT